MTMVCCNELLVKDFTYKVLPPDSSSFFTFEIFKIYLFLERGEGEREGVKHQCVVASHAPLTGDLAHNLGMCPRLGINLQPCGSQVGTQSTEPHQPGLIISLK